MIINKNAIIMGKYESIQTFLTIVDSGGFAAAGKQLGVSTAAVSRQLAVLEKNLGITLLRRNTRQLQLTPAGEFYYQRVRSGIEELKDAERALISAQEEISGDLHIIANRYFALHWIIPALPEFNHLYPKIKINLDIAEQQPDLLETEGDIIIGVSVEGPADYVRRRLLTTNYIFCASEAYLQRMGTPMRATDLHGHRFLQHSMRRPDNVIYLTKEEAFTLQPAMYLNDSMALCHAAIAGLGIAYLHDYMVKEAIEKGKLKEVLPAYSLKQKPVYLYRRQDRYLQPKIRCFIDYLIRDVT